MENRLIVGLGNIGSSYIKTRHNIGFIFIDIISKHYNLSFKETTAYKSLSTEIKINDVKTTFIKPTTYMNNSGQAVKLWKEWLKVENQNILIICDDLHLNVGDIRFRTSGSAGGHNGLKNIESNIGNDYLRLKIGIGNNYKHGEQANFVLSEFSDDELAFIMNNETYIINIIDCFIKNEPFEQRIKNINNLLSKRVISSVG